MVDKSNTESREAFEKHLERMWPARNDPYLRDCNDPFPENTYQDPDTEFAWINWQAAWEQSRINQYFISEKLKRIAISDIETQLSLMEGCTKKHIAKMLWSRAMPYIRAAWEQSRAGEKV